jgi:hypothetical protein
MSDKEKYLKFARRCIDMQRKAAVPDDRLLLLQMAQTWRELARGPEQTGEPVDDAKESTVVAR